MAQASYQGLARKWRPQTFADMVGQETVAQSLGNSMRAGRVSHGHILAGPRGVGKTTSARILAKSLNCVEGPTPTPCGKCVHCVAITQGSDMDVLEFDAASNTKVEQMRELLERVVLAPFAAKYKVYIIDEVHQLSNHSFNALLKTLEEPPPNVIFIFATTEFDKIPETIRSRCVIHQFRRLSVEDIVTRLRQVAAGEGIAMEEAVAREVFTLIAQASEGGMRDALVSFDQLLAMTSGKPDGPAAERLLGLASHATLAELVEALSAGDADKILRLIEDLVNRGRSLERFVKSLTGYLHEIMLIQSSAAGDLLTLTGDALERARGLAGVLTRPAVFNMINQVFMLEERLKRSTQSRFLIEFTFLRMGVIRQVAPIDELIDRLRALPDAALGAPAAAPAPRQAEPAPPRSEPARASIAPGAPERPRAVPGSTMGAPSPALSRATFSDSSPLEAPAETWNAEEDDADDVAAAPPSPAHATPAHAPAPQSNGSSPLAGLSRAELLEMISPQLPDAFQFLGRYLHTAAAMRADDTGLWITWPMGEKIASKTLAKPDNKRAIERTLEDLVGHPMELRMDFATAAETPSASSSSGVSAVAPRRAAAALSDSDPDSASDPDDDGYLDSLMAKAVQNARTALKGAAKAVAGALAGPTITEASTRAALEANPDHARRAKMAREFFSGAFIDSEGRNLAL